MMLRIDPPIMVVTPLGDGDCIGWIDYGLGHNTVWKVALWDTDDVVNVDESEIRVWGNAMRNIKQPEPFTERQV